MQEQAKTKEKNPFPCNILSEFPLPLSQTDRVQSIKLPKGPHFLLLPVGFNFENTIS